MSIAGFPTSSDIYLEVDGVKVAVVQSYSAKASKTSSAVEAFGESEPVATVPGQTSHVLELTRLYATDEAIRDFARTFGGVEHRRGHPGRHRLLRAERFLSGDLQAGPKDHLFRLPVEQHQRGGHPGCHGGGEGDHRGLQAH